MPSPSVCAHTLRVLLLLSLDLVGTVGCSRKTTATANAEWPEFRGPSQDGQSTATGLPVEWGPEKNVVWKASLPGRSWSSPIVANDRIYLTNAVAAKDDNDLHDKVSLRVLALNANTGTKIWDQEIFSIDDPHSFGVHDKNSHASPTPVFDDGRIYAHFGHFGSACLDDKGSIVWKTTEPGFKTELGSGGCAVIVDDLMIFNCDGLEDPFVVALDKHDGKERWRRARGRKAKALYALSTPLVIEVNGHKQLVTVGTRIAQALNPADGKEIWHLNHEEYCAVPRPVSAQGMIFLNTGFEKSNLLAIKADSKGALSDQQVLWQMNKNTPLTPSMIVVGDDLYMVADTGIVTCMNARDGTVYWQERVGKTTSASLLYADGKIYLQDEFGKGYVLKPGHKLEILATNDLADKSLASYAVHGHHLLIRTQHTLWCIGEKK